MKDKHPSGNPELIEQHKKIQHQGDRELAGTDQAEPKAIRRKKPKPRTSSEDDSNNSGSRSEGGSFVGP